MLGRSRGGSARNEEQGMAGAAGAATPIAPSWAQDAALHALPRAGASPQRYLLISNEPHRLAALAAALTAQPAEVLACLQDFAVGRRRGATDVIEAGPVVIDVPQRACRVGDAVVDLTFIEFEMLKALASQPNRFFDPLELLRIVWDGRHPVRMV